MYKTKTKLANNSDILMEYIFNINNTLNKTLACIYYDTVMRLLF